MHRRVCTEDSGFRGSSSRPCGTLPEEADEEEKTGRGIICVREDEEFVCLEKEGCRCLEVGGIGCLTER